MKNSSIIRILRGDDDLTDLQYPENPKMLTKATYDRKQLTLALTINEVAYQYYNVPKFVYNELSASANPSEYFALHILNRYPSEKLS